MRDFRTVTQAAILAVAMGLALAACTGGSSAAKSAQPRPSAAPVLAHPILKKLHQQTAIRFLHLHSANNPAAVVVLASARNLRPGQHNTVLTVPRVGNLVGSCRPGDPAVGFRSTYRGAGPPTVTEVREPLTKPASLYLLGGAPTASPVGGKQQFAFFQVTAGGETAIAYRGLAGQEAES
jgi:hypothetical protein